VVILDALFRGAGETYVPVFFDEAGHRVATQYLMSVLNGDMPAEQLMRYREAGQKLPGFCGCEARHTPCLHLAATHPDRCAPPVLPSPEHPAPRSCSGR
jgi:hypothetical protein